MKVLLIDAYDSFVYMINNYYEKLGCITKVIRVNENPLKAYENFKPDLVVLGPGPGTPKSKGYINILEELPLEQPIFGICLGHQAIGEFFGFELSTLSEPSHGKYSIVKNDGLGVFENISDEIKVVRYHSLIIKKTDYRIKNLIISAKLRDEEIIMGVRHKFRPIEGVQFHPESIGTEHGLDIIKNSLQLVRRKDGGK
ncbi:anthranilate synthase component II [Streptococcus sp. S784/96/1]|uniref:anthranilate synthase component II n=1 Tax=Streptococcus sp. S784/96/1 TaxID=2653499 RepID=UPI00138A12F6|nr:aminodeoxychorismate/anthranilate synthase component II [Streptococcus sp. S784/96/1]